MALEENFGDLGNYAIGSYTRDWLISLPHGLRPVTLLKGNPDIVIALSLTWWSSEACKKLMHKLIFSADSPLGQPQPATILREIVSLYNFRFLEKG